MAEQQAEHKEMDFPSTLLERNAVLCFSNGGEPASAVSPPAILHSPELPVISNGLRLALNEQNQLVQELTALISQQKDEYEQFLIAQREQLRRALAERRQKHSLTIITAMEEFVGKKLGEKEAEVERHARRNAELEDWFSRFRTESTAWRAKAMAEQAVAASLHAQIQQLATTKAAAASQAGEECCGNSPAEDARSVYVDLERQEAPELLCRACNRRPAAVVLIPCRHLCLCPACDTSDKGKRCPVCGCVRSGSVHIFLS